MSDELEETPPVDGGEETLGAPSAGDGDETLVAPAGGRSGGASRVGDERRFESGTVLADRYRIVTRLGKGGMGEVFRADDLKLDLPVALKFLPADIQAESERHAQLFAEVKVARKISHPNVCRVFDLGESDGGYFLSMEYIDGEDLQSLLRRIGRPSWSKSIELARQICEGLGAAHEVGVLHRDLKPANLMIDGEGRARITDFGLAALGESLGDDDAIAGTPFYMAPEQFSRRPATVASDLYSLGLVLYELFTGRRAFEPTSYAEARRLHERAIPQPPSEHRFGFDRAVEEVILRCLAKKPDDRPGSVEELLGALAEGAGGAVVEGAQLATLLASELGGAGVSTDLGSSSDLLAMHDRLARDLAREHGGREVDSAAGFLLLFQRPLEALRYALAYHRELATFAEGRGIELAGRVAIHLGEVEVRRNTPRDIERGARPFELQGYAREMTTRLLGLAGERQTLLSQGAFDVARRSARGEIEEEGELAWLAHGEFLFEGAEEPAGVFEVGAPGRAPLRAPEEIAGVTRVAAEATVLGWRPAPGLVVPQRTDWILQRKLGEGGFGEAWLVAHVKSGEERVYKFCYEKDRLFSLQREITVFRLLKEELGLRPDIARILDWDLDEAPYFLEFAHVEGGSVLDWARNRGGIAEVPMAERLEIVAQAATALAGAHSVGVLHKDVKPGNVLVRELGDGSAQAVLTDFGIGQITEQQRLAAKGITVLGMTESQIDTGGGTTTGSQLYLAPEVLAGQPATIQADVYALGVMLYQMVAGDLERPMPHGWRRQVDDELLREDIADCVDGDPTRRPGSAAEVAERIRSLEERRGAREAERRRIVAAERAHRRRRVLALVASVSTVFLLVVSFLAVQATRARADAERRQAQAEQLIDFMLNDLHEGLDRIGRLDLLEGVARSSLAHFESLSARDETPQALFQRGMTLQNIGNVLLDQGDAQAARASQVAAVELFEEAENRDPSDPTWSEGLSLGHLRLGNALREQGETEAAMAAYRSALEGAERLAAERPEDRQRALAVARIHFWIASLQQRIGDNDAVFESAGRALALLEDLPPAETIEWREHQLRFETHRLLSGAHRFETAFDEAVLEVESARAIAGEMQVEDPGNAFWARALAWCHLESGTLHFALGEPERALESLRSALVAFGNLSLSDPSRVEWRERLAYSRQWVGFVLSDLGRPAQALEEYERSRELLAALVEGDPGRVGWLRQLAFSHQLSSDAHHSQGRTVAAVRSLEAAVELLERIVSITGDDPNPRNQLSFFRILLGDLYLEAREPDRARELWTLAAEWLEPITAVSEDLQYLDTHAQALLRLGRVEESRPMVEKLLAEGFADPRFLELVRASGLSAGSP